MIAAEKLGRARVAGPAIMVVAAVTLATFALRTAAAAPDPPPPPPTEILSPLPGTPDADPATQISFLGAPASRLRDIVVEGSSSGRHDGRLRYYSTHSGGSFVPVRPFDSGEHVTVSATIVGYGRPRRVSTSFTVDDPYTLPIPRPKKPIPITATNVMRFHSRHDLVPPAVTVTTPAADPSLGDVFITPNAGPGQAGPMIVAPDGRLVWFKALPLGTKAFDLNVQQYAGAPALTWWQGGVVEGHGQGEDVISTPRYRTVATVRAGNGLYADLHDFRITSDGTAWITAFVPQRMDLSSYGGRADGLIDDGAVQLIDIKTGLVMFEWHALGHVPIADTYMHAPRRLGGVLDYFHVNSIDPLPGGRLLISARNTWTTYLVSATTGAVIWRLGGKESTFKIGPGATFAWQHDAEFLPDGTMSIFDNDAGPPEASQSRALDIALDPASGTATLVHDTSYPGHGILSFSQGDVQRLPGGDSFVGWGQIGQVSEFSPSGQLTFDMRLAPPSNSYRAFRYPWDTDPTTRPALVAAAPAGGTTQLYASWNGATNVAGWRVLAGTSASALHTVGSDPSTGFETAIAAPTAGPYVAVQAIASDGATLRTSAVVKAGS